MNEAIEWRIAPSLNRWLAEVPADRPVAMLMRHSVRGYLAPGDAGYDLPITDVGERLAIELGRMLAGRLRSLRASPILRCVQTARSLAQGANIQPEVALDRLLGDPGIFVVDGHRAGQVWRQLGHEAIMESLVEGSTLLPGLADAESSARFLVHHMLATAGSMPGIHVFVTHDSLVTATAARLLGQRLGPEAWPWYLEAVFFWRDETGTHAAYREATGHRPGELCSLSPADVCSFARREIALTLGLDCPAHLFLAGGAFKTLLTGRPPRDLDVWAPSQVDRETLLACLRERGAEPMNSRPFGEAFRLGDRVVEVPHRIEPSTLEERLERFDIGLSAIGVEHRPGDSWRAVIHPSALASVTRREVLLMKPLANWKHCLTTLERARRYAAELDFRLPSEEEAEVWKVFESQPAKERQSMLERFDRTGHGGYGVREEAQCRL